LVHAHTLTPWGRDVDREAIRTFRREMEVIAPDQAVAFHEPACRYLADALACFTHLYLPSPTQVPTVLQEGRPGFYLEPLTTGSFYEGYVDGSLGATGVSMQKALAFYTDLEPVAGDRGPIRTFTFAGGTFAAHRVVPWSKTTVQAYHQVPHSQPTVLWLDFGERPPGAATVRVATTDETVVGEWTVPSARHIMGFALAGPKVPSGHLIITLTADQPLTAHPVIGAQSGDHPMPFPLDSTRSLSTHYWLRPPFSQPRFRDASPAVLAPDGRLSLPIPYGDSYRALRIGLVLEILSEAPIDTGSLRIFHNQALLLETAFEPERRRFNRAIHLDRPENASHLELRLTSDVPPPAQLRIVRLTIAAEEWDDPGH
jgi:hypothetical protein